MAKVAHGTAMQTFAYSMFLKTELQLKKIFFHKNLNFQILLKKKS